MILHPSYPLLLLALAVGAFVLVSHRRGRTPRSVTIRRVAMAALLLLVAVRPTVGAAAGRAAASDVDVLFVVDRSNSVAAEDYGADKRPRLEGMRADGIELVEAFAGAQYGLITFDSEARVELPFTTDGAAMTTALDTVVQQNANYGAGSGIHLGLTPALELLTRRAEEHPERRQYLVYLGDGEETSETEPEPFDDLSGVVDDGVVLGYGTAEGGRMRTEPNSDHYVYDHTKHQEAISTIDEAALNDIADRIGIDYEHRTAPGGLADRADDLGGGFIASGDDVVSGREVYWLPALGLATLALVELWQVTLGAIRTRRELR